MKVKKMNDNKDFRLESSDYIYTINDIKSKIATAQRRIVQSANCELIMLYWHIGLSINNHSVWGNKFIDNLAMDIKLEFPTMKGFSVRNLKYMAKFASCFPDSQFVQATLAQISWYHNITLLDKIKDLDVYKWYVEKTIENGWSRNVMVNQIESDLFKRQVLNPKVTNFKSNLSVKQGELATNLMKDPYIFDFVSFKEEMIERDIENELVRNVAKLLLELGKGFAFMGNQYHIEVGGEDYYLDLLFYNLHLRCYVVIELKTGDFKPEYAGKLNFYLSAVDNLLKSKDDNPSIGILLCKNKNNIVAEYSLKDISKPIGISEYKLTGYLPEGFENALPTVEEITYRIKSQIEIADDEV